MQIRPALLVYVVVLIDCVGLVNACVRWLLYVLKENSIELKLSLRHLVITAACCDYRDIVGVKDIQPHTHSIHQHTHS